MKDLGVERIESRLMAFEQMTPSSRFAQFYAFWMRGTESCLTKTQTLMMKTRSLFKRGSILDHNVSFSSFKPTFHTCFMVNYASNDHAKMMMVHAIFGLNYDKS